MIAELRYNLGFQIRIFGNSINLFFGDIHKGIWLGNKFYNFYYFPEQNYLTKKFSGTWHSIDLGFSYMVT